MSLVALSTNVYFIHPPTNTEESLSLDEVNLSHHPQIFYIIEGVVKEAQSSTSDKIHFLTVRLMNDSCGTIMKIVAHTRNNLSWYDGYTGYTIVDKMPVIIVNKSNIKLSNIPYHKGIFPMANHFSPPFVYDPNTWLFILRNNNHARYYEDRGWIWFKQMDFGCKEQPISQ